MKGQGLIAVMGGTVLILESEKKYAFSATDDNIFHPDHFIIHTRMCECEKKTDTDHGHPAWRFRPI
jgi:hypothetical protein